MQVTEFVPQIALGQRLPVGVRKRTRFCERGQQREMRRLGFVQAGEDRVDRAKLVLGRHHQFRPAVCRDDGICRHGTFKRPNDRRPNGDDAPAFAPGRVDRERGPVRYRERLGRREARALRRSRRHSAA